MDPEPDNINQTTADQVLEGSREVASGWHTKASCALALVDNPKAKVCFW